MKIEIFDVEHGQCSVVTCPNGRKVMIDCGDNTSTGWKPSKHFAGSDIELLIITNYDRDHTSDLNGVLNDCNVRLQKGNPTINSSALALMKAEYGMAPGIKRVYSDLQKVEAQRGLWPTGHADLGDVEVRWFWNSYPYFTDANNLSVATFLKYGDFVILFPGDLETRGWTEILKLSEFREWLQKTTVLVAAHHGRENGFSDAAFEIMRPSAVVISDSGIEHSSQETQRRYRQKVNGCKVSTSIGVEERFVLTTRADGKVTINTNGTSFSVDIGKPASFGALAFLGAN